VESPTFFKIVTAFIISQQPQSTQHISTAERTDDTDDEGDKKSRSRSSERRQVKKRRKKTKINTEDKDMSVI
jgi:hypothetical protein